MGDEVDQRKQEPKPPTQYPKKFYAVLIARCACICFNLRSASLCWARIPSFASLYPANRELKTWGLHPFTLLITADALAFFAILIINCVVI